MTIKNLLTGADKAIEEDKALEESLSKELNDAFANTLEENWAGTGFSTADNEPDNPMRIKNPERKLFGGVTLTNASPSKSPEDMEKEYISEAERAMKELTEARTENENDIAEYKRNIEASTANIVLINRLFAGHESFLKEALPVSKPKTPKKPGAK